MLHAIGDSLWRKSGIGEGGVAFDTGLSASNLICATLILLIAAVHPSSRTQGTSTMLLSLQITALGLVTAYLCQRGWYLRHRNLQSSETLIEHLRQSPIESESLWSRLQDARLVMEMVDFAERHGDANEMHATQLLALRRDAMEYRLELAAEMARRAILIRAR